MHGPLNKLRLSGEILRFHVRNAAGHTPSAVRRMHVPVTLGRHQHWIELRPDDGDLFIFFEMLERQTYFISDALLPPTHVRTIVDAGANIGLASLFLASRYPQARIVAVEPNPGNFELLVRNTRQEPRVTPLQAAVAGAENMGDVYIGTEGRGSHFQVNTTGAGVAVRAVTIETICREHGLATLDLLKMDIEGGELEVFANPEFMPRVGAVVIELHDRYRVDAFNRDIAPFGFAARVLDASKDPDVYCATRSARK